MCYSGDMYLPELTQAFLGELSAPLSEKGLSLAIFSPRLVNYETKRKKSLVHESKEGSESPELSREDFNLSVWVREKCEYCTRLCASYRED